MTQSKKDKQPKDKEMIIEKMINSKTLKIYDLRETVVKIKHYKITSC